MGGADKPAQLVGGRTLLDRVLTAVADADRSVVVGPQRVVTHSVRWAREEPSGGGPLAALAAGLAHVTADVFVLVAADLPFLEKATVTALRQDLGLDLDGRLLVDDDGREQWLCSAWRTAAVKLALNGAEVAHRPLRAVLGELPFDSLRWQPQDPGLAPPWTDCDTEDDLRRARDRV